MKPIGSSFMPLIPISITKLISSSDSKMEEKNNSAYRLDTSILPITLYISVTINGITNSSEK